MMLVTIGFGSALAETGAGKRLTLEVIFDSEELTGNSPEQVQWLPDGSAFIFRLADEDGTWLWKENVTTGNRSRIAQWDLIMDELRAQRPGVGARLVLPVERASRAGLKPALAPDGSALVGSVAGDLYLLDLQSGKARFLTGDAEPELFPAFSPGSDRLAYVKRGDLYWLDLRDGVVHRLTNRGDRPELLNGVADWVYEEELGIATSFWWSPDGSRLAFVSYDTSPVGLFPITDELGGSYADLELQRYPKAGTANSKVRLGVVGLDGGAVSWLPVGSAEEAQRLPGGHEEHYLARAGWTPSGKGLWYQSLTRDQTTLRLGLCDPESGRCSTLIEESDPAWVNVFDDMLWIDDSSLVWSSERDGWRHLYLYAIDDGRAVLQRQLTEGRWEVREVYGLDSTGTRLLIQATRDGALERHLYSVSLDGGGIERLSTQRGTHSALAAPDGLHYLAWMSNLTTPPRLSLYRSDGSAVRTVDEGVIATLAGYDLSPLELSTVHADDGTLLHTCTIKPPELDPAAQYPVLLYVYGGPSSQLVRDVWGGRRHLFFQLLAQQGIVVHWVDNRGTTARGRDFERAIHRRLGEVELQDQLAAVRNLIEEPWVDADRIGIYGGSYGGFMTLMGMLRAPGVFRAGIAYAPGTDWSLYDTIWTERYMDTPAENPEGYQRSSVVAMAQALEGDLLLVHGAMDNNVHMQQTMTMIDALVRHGKSFDLMIYPQVRHPIRVSRHRLHFHRLKMQFLLDHLVGACSADPDA